MAPGERDMVEAAFGRIGEAVTSIGEAADIDAALESIFHSVNQIAPGMDDAVATLTVEEMGNVLLRFHQRSLESTAEESGNSPEHIFLALAVTAEMWRRARQDGIGVMEWCRRARMKGLMDE